MEVYVKCMGFDDRGKVRLAMKGIDQKTGKEAAAPAEQQPGAEQPGGLEAQRRGARGYARPSPPGRPFAFRLFMGSNAGTWPTQPIPVRGGICKRKRRSRD